MVALRRNGRRRMLVWAITVLLVVQQQPWSSDWMHSGIMTTPNSVHNNIPNPPLFQRTINKKPVVRQTSVRPASPAVKEEHDPLLPTWFVEYAEWHHDSLQAVHTNHTLWTSYRYIIIQCTDIDPTSCGGAADRLRLLPFIVFWAHCTRRLLFVHWSRPHPLQAFLVPNSLLDWRIPLWLSKELLSDQPSFKEKDVPSLWSAQDTHDPNETVMKVQRFVATAILWSAQDAHDSNETVLRVQRLVMITKYYNNRDPSHDVDMRANYSSIWAALFRPSPGVQSQIDETYRRLQLEPQQYGAVHIRSLYSNNRTREFSEIETAMHCANQYNQNPLLIMSDAADTVQYALEYGKRNDITVMTRDDFGRRPLLHLDRGANFLKASRDGTAGTPSDYYETFVDLYLLSKAAFVSYGMGTYGRWGAEIGGLVVANRTINYLQQQCQQLVETYS